MALVINGVSPTEIKVVQNGTTTDLTVLKYGSQAVWGKPYSLSLTQGTNTTLTANRTHSPNMHASTGVLAQIGSKVYHGDILDITATPESGYKIKSFTINGTEYGNGQTSAVTQTITVTGDVIVQFTTESAVSWHTVWTGSQSAGSFSWKTSASGKKTTTLANDTPTGVDWSLPTRITGTAKATAGGLSGNSNTNEITALELVDGTSYELVSSSYAPSGAVKGSVYLTIKRTASTPNAVVTGVCTRISGTDMYFASLTLTKVEQYY